MDQNPWKGLHYYIEEDSDRFFGRAVETESLLRMVRLRLLTVVFAPSGWGKTSLLRAGLIPRLRRQESLPLIVRVGWSESAGHPSQQIIAAVRDAATSACVELEATDTDSIEATETLWEFFHRCQFWSERLDPVEPVLILDQFEEVFTVGASSAEKDAYLEQLADLVENRMPRSVEQQLEMSGRRLPYDTSRHPCRVILALREDYVSRLDRLAPTMPSVMQNRFELGRLDHDRAVEVVCGAGGSCVSKAVAEEIVNSVSGEHPGAQAFSKEVGSKLEVEPAYLSLMGHELFRRMVETGRERIDLELVNAEKGNILQDFYDRSFEGSSPEMRCFVEDRLVDESGFRLSVPLEIAAKQGIAIAELDRLRDARLLRYEDRLGTKHVELSHDLLTGIALDSRMVREKKKEDVRRHEQEKEAAFKLSQARRATRNWMILCGCLAGVIGLYVTGLVVKIPQYSINFIPRHGVFHPKGILPFWAVPHRSSTMRFSRSGWLGMLGPVVRVDYVDAKFRPAIVSDLSARVEEIELDVLKKRDDEYQSSIFDKDASFDYVYDKRGNLVQVVIKNITGHMIRGISYIPYSGLVAQEQKRPQERKVAAAYFGENGLPKAQSGTAEYVALEYDKSGNEVNRSYLDISSNPVLGPSGVYQEKRVYPLAKREHKTIITYLDQKGRMMYNSDGYAQKEITYDNQGNITRKQYFGIKNEPLLFRGTHIQQYTYDQWGRLKGGKYYGIDGKPSYHTYFGLGVAFEYDASGNLLKQESVENVDNNQQSLVTNLMKLVYANHSSRRASTYIDYDYNRRPIRVIARDKLGRLLFFVKLHYNVDEPRPLVESLCLEPKQSNNMYRQESNCGRWIATNFDSRGLVLTKRILEDKLINPHAAVNSMEYNPDGSIRQLCVGPLDKEKCFRYSYNRFGQIVDTLRGTLTELSKGNYEYRMHSAYNALGRLVAEYYYAKDRTPMIGPNGVHKTLYKYDKLSRIILYRNEDIYGNPSADSSGIVEVKTEYNQQSQPIKIQFFGLQGQPAEFKGEHIVTYQYDKLGRKIKETRLRADGSSSMYPSLEVSTEFLAYDMNNSLVKHGYTSPSGQLSNGPFGYSRAIIESDPNGQKSLILQGVDGKPTLSPQLGFAIRRVTDNRYGKNQIEDSYFDSKGRPMLGPLGYAEVRRTRSRDGMVLEETYLGSNGEPVVGPMGYHRMKTMDHGGETLYLDILNNPIPLLETHSALPLIVVNNVKNLHPHNNNRLPKPSKDLQAGDILWSYGSWQAKMSPWADLPSGTSFPGSKEVLNKLQEGLISVEENFEEGGIPATVIRNGRLIALTIKPKLLDANGMDLDLIVRYVPWIID